MNMIMAANSDKESSNVKVIVRVRPPNDFERNGNGKHVVEVMDENVLVFDPKEPSSPVVLGRKRRHRDIRQRRVKDLKFAFDRVFGPESSNEEVFEHSTKTVLDGLLGGYNCSVFAYGATGAGKTHTMLGTESHPGVIYRTMIHLYQHIKELSAEKTFDIAVSYLEVYNEQIRDLLLPRGTLPIREDPNSGVIITGLSLHKPSTAEELLYMLQFGNKNRTQHPTDANAESSRSHAVFQVFVRQKDRTANISAEVKVAKMCLVDLAGSERATVTKNRGARLREGANINRSLLALGNVINSLADNKYKGHIPYRDSKLTRLLKDSLGGNCRTIMIAAVSPSVLSYEDTYNTLKYADRAKNIRLNMKKNVLNIDLHVSRYGKIVEELRKEICELKGKLQQCDRTNVAQTLSLPADIQTLREGLQEAYNDRRALRDTQLQQETSSREIKWRLHCKRKCLHRASQLSQTQPQTMQKIEGVIQGLEKKLSGQEAESQTVSQQLQNSMNTLHALHSQAAAVVGTNPLFSQVLEVSVQKQRLELELNNSQHYIHHLRRLARSQSREAVASETLISALLSVVQRQHLELLSRPGPVAPDVAAGYQKVCDVVGQWGVSWADVDQEGEGQPGPFHINDIIDIPLITSPDAALDRLPLSGNLATSTSNAVPMGGGLPITPAVSCPGRVVNKVVSFNTPAMSQPSSTQQPSSTCCHYPATLPSSCDCDSQPPAKCARLDDSVNMLHSVTSDCGDCRESSAKETPSSVVHAGHTPNPKKIKQGPTPTTMDQNQNSHCSCAAQQSKIPSAISGYNAGMNHHGLLAGSNVNVMKPLASNSAATNLQSAGQANVIVPCIHNPPASLPGGNPSVLVPLPDSEVPHNLNETFSLEDCREPADNGASNDGNSTVVLGASSLLSVPVIDGSLSPSVKCMSSLGANMVDGAQSMQPANSDLRIPTIQNSAGPNFVSASCTQTLAGASDNRLAENTVEKMSRILQCSSDESTNKTDKENTTTNCHAKRAINFDGAVSSPHNGHGLSYADALKFSTPPRHPLQDLNQNSPQVMAKSNSTESSETLKMTGRSSMYLAGPQTYDNMRRLKEMGLPSLVENLITGNKTGKAAQGGSRPSYMQPTKSHAQRVRSQTSFTDDNFQPKRVPHRSLAHTRSKSASSLLKTGWKL